MSFQLCVNFLTFNNQILKRILITFFDDYSKDKSKSVSDLSITNLRTTHGP